MRHRYPVKPLVIVRKAVFLKKLRVQGVETFHSELLFVHGIRLMLKLVQAGLIRIKLKLIEHLPRLDGVTYVTDSVLHAQHLALRGMRTVVLGGELKPETEALVGPDALATLDRYNFNCGFWGSNGIAAEQGLTTPDIEEAQVKRISMRHTAKRFVISDASKFGMVAPVKFADFRDATIITAGEVPAKYRAMDNVITV